MKRKRKRVRRRNDEPDPKRRKVLEKRKYPDLFFISCKECKQEYTKIFNDLYCRKCKKMSCIKKEEDVKLEVTTSLFLPYNIVLKPRFNDFNDFFDVDSFQLMVGISNSKGYVTYADECGLFGELQWPECIGIKLEDSLSNDKLIDEHLEEEKIRYQKDGYSNESNICNNFVIRYLKKGKDSKEMTDEDFIEKYIMNITDYIEKYYINLENRMKHTCSRCGKDDLQRNDRYRCAKCNNVDICKLCSICEAEKHVIECGVEHLINEMK